MAEHPPDLTEDRYQMLKVQRDRRLQPEGPAPGAAPAAESTPLISSPVVLATPIPAIKSTAATAGFPQQLRPPFVLATRGPTPDQRLQPVIPQPPVLNPAGWLLRSER